MPLLLLSDHSRIFFSNFTQRDGAIHTGSDSSLDNIGPRCTLSEHVHYHNLLLLNLLWKYIHVFVRYPWVQTCLNLSRVFSLKKHLEVLYMHH